MGANAVFIQRCQAVKRPARMVAMHDAVDDAVRRMRRTGQRLAPGRAVIGLVPPFGRCLRLHEHRSQ
jgi:hypothetical protein